MSSPSQITDPLLDRLVDGELTSQERRELLSALEQSEDGWRRCALAFVESQVWNQEFKQLAFEPVASLKSPSPTPTRLSTVPSWLALAASLLLAFVFGWQVQRSWVSPTGHLNETTRQVAESVILPSTSGTESETNGQIAGNEPKSANDDVLTVYVQDHEGQRRAIGIPLVDAGAFDPRFDTEFNNRFQPAISDPVRQQIESRGYQVNSRRRFAPLWMENGHPLIVPVEDTQIVPVNRVVY